MPSTSRGERTGRILYTPKGPILSDKFLTRRLNDELKGIQQAGQAVETGLLALEASTSDLDTRLTTAEGEIDTLQTDMTSVEGRLDLLEASSPIRGIYNALMVSLGATLHMPLNDSSAGPFYDLIGSASATKTGTGGGGVWGLHHSRGSSAGDTYLTVSSSPVYTGECTIMFVIEYANLSAGFQTVIASGHSSGTQVLRLVNGQLQHYYTANTTQADVLSRFSRAHVAMTINSTGSIVMFVDGIAQALGTTVAPASFRLDKIGADTSNANILNGAITSDVAVFPSVLTSPEIRTAAHLSRRL